MTAKLVVMYMLVALIPVSILTFKQAGADTNTDVLGGQVSSTEDTLNSHSVKSRFTKTITNANGATYSIQEVQTTPTTLRKYITPSGVIFGIAWTGNRHPDLIKILGSYIGSYQQLAAQRPPKPGERHHSVKSDNLVVEKYGHPLKLQGRAYDPTLLPNEVSADEIK